MDTAFIGQKIARLRKGKNISAREMSLVLGQSQSYINKIENNMSMPSMEMFFVICDYFNVTPSEFFRDATQGPLDELMIQAKRLNTTELQHLVSLVRKMV